MTLETVGMLHCVLERGFYPYDHVVARPVNKKWDEITLKSLLPLQQALCMNVLKANLTSKLQSPCMFSAHVVNSPRYSTV